MTLTCVLLANESVANLGFFDLFSESTLFVSAGVLTRIAGVLLGGGMRLFPGGTVHLRLAILFILGLAAAPVAISVVQVQNMTEELFFPYGIFRTTCRWLSWFVDKLSGYSFRVCG